MKLDDLLGIGPLHSQELDRDDFLSNLASRGQLTIFYGETYDGYGETVDSLKYYFYTSMLAQALREEGINAKGKVLIADSAAKRNAKLNEQRKYTILGQNRADFVRKCSSLYGLDLDVSLMSDYIESDQFTSKRQEIIDFCKANGLMEAVEETVPEGKVEEERAKDFLYSFDEIATIIDLDVKVGPPREDLYDSMARKISQSMGSHPLTSVYLNPSFPLGKDWAYFFGNEDIERYGVTAYKGCIMGLAANRIFVGRTKYENEDQLSLIDRSFIPRVDGLPNPVLDAGIIAEMAKMNLRGEQYAISAHEHFANGTMSEDIFRKHVRFAVESYLLLPLNGGS